MLKRHEGVRDKVYMCSAGYETIGVGRNISESGLGLSEDEIDYLLNNDIKRCREELTIEYEWFSKLDRVTTKRRGKSFIEVAGLNKWVIGR
jgi:lysozyme